MTNEMIKGKYRAAVKKSLKGDITGKDMLAITIYQCYNSGINKDDIDSNLFVEITSSVSYIMN